MADTLASPDVVKRLAQEYAVALKDPKLKYGAWCDDLERHLAMVERADLEQRASPAFQKELWDSETVAKAGQGQISVDQALSDREFRLWLAERSTVRLPEDRQQATQFLQGLYEELIERLARFIQKTPRLKIFRVLASFFPRQFTTVADVGRMAKLHALMLGGNLRADEVVRHRNVLDRLAVILGPAPGDLKGWVERMTFPWYLFEKSAETRVSSAPAGRLDPLPAGRRRRGLTSTKGNYDWVLRVLDFVGDGVPRDDLYSFLRQEHPGVKDSTIAIKADILRSELNVLDRAGDLFIPSESGRKVVESGGDPAALAPWLLTRILGIDHAIAALRDEGSLPQKELIDRLMRVNPGWTTNFAPQTILAWLRALGLTVLGPEGRLRLTPRGNEWAAMIHWKPESLEVAAPEEPPAPAGAPEEARVALPPLKDLLAKMPTGLRFTEEQVATLHAGLWSHERRHFAILSGLSGSGKTSLARSYARALIELTSGSVERQLLTVPVAPGWTDPSPLLGYLNPLRTGEYVGTPFLDLLLSAANQPGKVHVAVLDEMNLSHPEQYLAPLLSGMELANERLVLHGEEEEMNGVPGWLTGYPANLVLIGTVNMDETTHGLSDKVLDRALTIEFWDIDLDQYPRWGARGLAREGEVKQVLEDLLGVLSPVRLHFGWRVVDDVLDFMKRTGDEGYLPHGVALDRIVYSKIVPKLRGYDSKEFRSIFEACGKTLEHHGLKRSAEKVRALLRDLENTGSARFWR